MRWLLMVALVLFYTAGAGCSSEPKQAKWEGEAKTYAVYATQITLYPGAKVTDAMGSDSYGDTPADHVEGMAWWFEVPATQAELDAWYATHLTGAQKSTDDEGTIVYTLAPTGGEAGETMGVRLSDRELRVFERARAGKHKG
jgi:hypothetical protein